MIPAEIPVEIALLVFTVYNAAIYLVSCWRERLIREMRRIHAERLAAERRLSTDTIARIAAERDVYRERYLGLMGEHEEVLS